MGSSEQCVDQEHEACITTWCDCGCHHDLIDEHYDGKHVGAPNWHCQNCIKVAHGEDDEVAPALVPVSDAGVASKVFEEIASQHQRVIERLLLGPVPDLAAGWLSPYVSYGSRTYPSAAHRETDPGALGAVDCGSVATIGTQSDDTIRRDVPWATLSRHCLFKRYSHRDQRAL